MSDDYDVGYAAGVTAERERIRQLAIDNDAVYKTDPYQQDYDDFADLLTDPEPLP